MRHRRGVSVRRVGLSGLLARSADKLQAMAKGRDDSAIPLIADVTDAGSRCTHAITDTFTAQTGRLDVLFNNAGDLCGWWHHR